MGAGAPELAFEILSPSDSPERWTFDEKLRSYRACGVSELVVFMSTASPAHAFACGIGSTATSSSAR